MYIETLEYITLIVNYLNPKFKLKIDSLVKL